jgi:hypothetical protein
MRKLRPLTFALIAAAAAAALSTTGLDAKQKSRQSPEDAFKREETMLLNLNKAPKSPRFYILTSLKQTRIIEKNIDRCLSQVDQADAVYHKMTHKPDDRTLSASIKRLKDAQQTAKQLEQQLQDAQEQLKADVQQTLIMPK